MTITFKKKKKKAYKMRNKSKRNADCMKIAIM